MAALGNIGPKSWQYGPSAASMAKSRSRKNQSERSDLPCHTIMNEINFREEKHTPEFYRHVSADKFRHWNLLFISHWRWQRQLPKHVGKTQECRVFLKNNEWIIPRMTIIFVIGLQCSIKVWDLYFVVYPNQDLELNYSESTNLI